MFFIFVSLLLVTSSVAHVDDEIPYSYIEATGIGPSNWGKISPTCEDGRFQSPIDIGTVPVAPYLGKLQKNYKPAPAVLENRGHYISVRWTGNAGQIYINGTYYKLEDCHWHTPSEHTFNGTRYDMELHIVHETPDNKTAVIGILYKFGSPDPFLARLFPYIKLLGKKEKELGIVNPQDIGFGSREYYRYMGSLTTPPCTEGVVWTIIEKVKTVSREQVEALKEKVEDGFEENARPTQPLGGRPVLFFTSRKDY